MWITSILRRTFDVRFRLTAALIAALVGAAAMPAAPVVAQELQSRRPAVAAGNVDATLDTLARIPQLQAADTREIFARLGFKPDMPANDWLVLSFRDQMEIAYRAAQAASPPDGAQFLAETATIVAEKYESVRFDPEFVDLFHPDRTAPGSRKIRFGTPKPAELRLALATDVLRQLEALSVYVEGSNEFGRVAVLKRAFNLRSPKLEQALRHRNSRDMLREGLALAVPPPTAEARVAALAEDVTLHFDSAADPVMRDVVARLKSQIPDVLPVQSGTSVATLDSHGNIALPPAGPGEVGASPRRVSEAAALNAQFDRRVYPTAESRLFRRVLTRVEGPGGIVIGAEVTADRTRCRPQRVWIDLAGQDCTKRPEKVFGAIVVSTSGQSTYRYGPVACDELVAAKHMVFDRFAGLNEWRPGEAIGLMTIDEATPFIPANGDLFRAGRQFDTILHPALIDLDIGRAAALADLLPSAGAVLLQSAKRDPAVAGWLASLERREVFTWRWHDLPMRVRAVGDRLQVGPTGDAARPVLDFRAFREQDATAEDEAEQAGKSAQVGIDLPEFARTAPVLIATVPEYRRIDSLMRTAGLFRWARENGARFVGSEPRLADMRPKTPDGLIIGIRGDWVAVAPRAPFEKRREDFCARLDHALADLEKQAERVQAQLIGDGLEYCVASDSGPGSR